MTKTGTTNQMDANSWIVVRRIFSENFSRYKFQYLFAALLMISVAAATALPAYIIRDVVNDVFVKQSISSAYLIATAMFLAFATRGFATYGYIYVLGRIGNNIIARYQRRVFAKLLELGVSYQKNNRSSFVVTKLNANISGVQAIMNQFFTVFIKDLLTLVALVTVMIIQDPYMSIITVTVLPVLAYVLSRYVKRMKQLAVDQVNLGAKVSTSMIESSQGMDILKSFTMEDVMTARIDDLTKKAEVQNNKIIRLNAKTKPPTEVLAGLAIGGVIAFGGYRVIELQHDIGALISFLTAAMLAYEPARKLGSFRVAFEQAITNARMLFDLLDTPATQRDRDTASDLQLDSGEIRFENVDFSYATSTEPVLTNLSFVAEAQKTTALVGPSGGGKSTVIALIQRFFDVDGGKILVDGQDINDVKIKSLRQQIAYVSQQPILFEGSILENIRLGRPDATDEEVFEASTLANAHEFILEQPEGYDTMVGEMGSNLSGGQRQRISIARAFLRNAKILLLDEATSALDNKSEKKVQKALETLMTGRTTIVVAHRLSTIRDANCIYFIDEGRIVEHGTHGELRKKNSHYASLYAIAQEAD